MIDDVALEQVVARVYEAAVRPGLWRPTLNAMADATGAQGVQMMRMRPEGAVLHANSEGLDDVLEAFFREGWNRRNPRELRSRLRGVAAAEIITDRDLFTPEELDHEPWQTEFLDRFGLRWFCAFGLQEVFEDAPFFMSIDRLRRDAPFDDAEVASLAKVMPHLRRAVRLSAALGAAAQDGMMDALTALRRPAILLDDLRQVTRMNDEAQAQLGDGLVVAQGRLRATHPPADARLQRLLSSVCWAGAACRAPPVDAVALPRETGQALIVQAAPLVDSARDLFQQSRALVILKTLERVSPPAQHILQQAFGLTPAEARLAARLAAGDGVAGAAQALGVSTGTVRTHLKAIFSKTGVRGQPELAVLLSRLGAALGD